MKILIILNGISRKKRIFSKRFYPTLSARHEVKVEETKYAGHAEELASRATRGGWQLILAAGGDGTMHQVLNGVLNAEGQSPVLGLIPLGSGNDLARTFGLTARPQQLIRLIEANQPRQIDVGRVMCHDAGGKSGSRYFINECSIGMGPEVVRRINEAGRSAYPGLMYLKAIVSTFLLHRPEVVRIAGKGISWHGKARVFAMANGRSFGHSIYIAPGASVEDGRFDTFLASNMPLWRFLFLLQRLKSPKKINDPFLTYGQLDEVVLEAEKILPLEADGELVGYTPLHCEILPRKVNFLY